MIADAGEIGTALANKPSAASCAPRAKIQRAVGLEPLGAGFGEDVLLKLRLCMADESCEFFGWLGRSSDRLLLQNLPQITDRAAVDRFFLLMFVGHLTVTNI
ncbi:hypothetical protein QT971_00215 [Microcoleus sp. herbarium19]|uniref:hypothetical protein n=1 Tax=unclassified Microcoleus TaxID=2642155 RepID=UPI002FCFEB90